MMKMKFTAKGTTCEGCSDIIIEQAKKAGATKVEFDRTTEKGTIEFDERKTSAKRIFAAIEEKGYNCEREDFFNKIPRTSNNSRYAWVFIAVGLALAGYFLYGLVGGISLPTLDPNISYALLFAVGLLTGFHCIAMCGGFVISYTAKDRQENRTSHLSHAQYAVGKTISYTFIGAIFGLIGSIIAFTPLMRGISGILAGIFLLLFGLRMLNIFPGLRRFGIRTPSFIAKRLGGSGSPLVIGLLNGLMIACGPLQAVYIMAAGTGSALEGAKLLFIFGLGTLPAMLGFAYFATYVTRNLTHSILRASGVLVILIGLIMINNGLALTGTGYDLNSMVVRENTDADKSKDTEDGYQEIRMDVISSGWRPDRFVLKKDVPVRWIIQGKDINGCNNAIVVPKLGLEFSIQPGEQVIEFTPRETGVIPWSCWMGMINGQFIVVEGDEDASQALLVVPNVKASSGCGCGR